MFLYILITVMYLQNIPVNKKNIYMVFIVRREKSTIMNYLLKTVVALCLIPFALIK